MSGTGGINHLANIRGQQPDLADQDVGKARAPQKLNRHSIETRPGTSGQVRGGVKRERKPLSSYRVSVIPNKEVRKQLGQRTQDKLTVKLDATRQKLDSLKNALPTKSRASSSISECDSEIQKLKLTIKTARRVFRSANENAASETLSSQYSSTDPLLLSQTKEQLAEASSLLKELEGKLSNIKNLKKEFMATAKSAQTLENKLLKLEKNLKKVDAVLNKKAKNITVSQHQAQIDHLSKQLKIIKNTGSDGIKLKRKALKEEAQHTGVTPHNFEQRLNSIQVSSEQLKTSISNLLNQSKSAKSQAVIAEKQAKKEQTAETKEINEAYNRMMAADRPQNKKQTHTGIRSQRKMNSPDLRTTTQTRANPTQRRRDNTSKLSSSGTRSALRGKTGTWTAKDAALEKRLAALKDQVYHDKITPGKSGQSFEQLEDRLWHLNSIDDLKSVVADRRATKITIPQQRKYLGLLKAAVQGMAKNTVHAEQMTSELIKDMLKEQPDEARTAINLMHKTKSENLEKRLNRLRRS